MLFLPTLARINLSLEEATAAPGLNIDELFCYLLDQNAIENLSASSQAWIQTKLAANHANYAMETKDFF